MSERYCVGLGLSCSNWVGFIRPEIEYNCNWTGSRNFRHVRKWIFTAENEMRWKGIKGGHPIETIKFKKICFQVQFTHDQIQHPTSTNQCPNAWSVAGAAFKISSTRKRDDNRKKIILSKWIRASKWFQKAHPGPQSCSAHSAHTHNQWPLVCGGNSKFIMWKCIQADRIGDAKCLLILTMHLINYIESQ